MVSKINSSITFRVRPSVYGGIHHCKPFVSTLKGVTRSSGTDTLTHRYEKKQVSPSGVKSQADIIECVGYLA